MVNSSEVHEIVKKYTIGDGMSIVVDYNNSHGSWLVDSLTKKEYLDCYSQFASQPLGWNHPSLIAELKKISSSLLSCKIANSDMYSREYAAFIYEFAQICPDFQHFFFIDGGALAVENSLKCAFDWFFKKYGKDNFDVIHLQKAFHGRSGYTLSLTNTDPIKTDGFSKFPWTRIVNPTTPESTYVSLKQAEIALKKGNVAAIILETIQGEGGDNHFSKYYLEELRKLADQYEALLIFDEVQCGMGITGKMWAYEHFNVKPDLMCFGKKTQVCGFASNNRIDDVENVFKKSSRINSTWGGNIIDMVRFVIIKQIIQQEKLLDNAALIGAYLVQQLKNIKEIHNVRGRGLMIAFDLENTERRNEVLHNMSHNMLALKSGERSIRLRPHLTFSKQDADFACGFIDEAISQK
jgi:L-lysine 6-transaminase